MILLPVQNFDTVRCWHQPMVTYSVSDSVYLLPVKSRQNLIYQFVCHVRFKATVQFYLQEISIKLSNKSKIINHYSLVINLYIKSDILKSVREFVN